MSVGVVWVVQPCRNNTTPTATNGHKIPPRYFFTPSTSFYLSLWYILQSKYPRQKKSIHKKQSFPGHSQYRCTAKSLCVPQWWYIRHNTKISIKYTTWCAPSVEASSTSTKLLQKGDLEKKLSTVSP